MYYYQTNNSCDSKNTNIRTTTSTSYIFNTQTAIILIFKIQMAYVLIFVTSTQSLWSIWIITDMTVVLRKTQTAIIAKSNI